MLEPCTCGPHGGCPPDCPNRRERKATTASGIETSTKAARMMAASLRAFMENEAAAQMIEALAAERDALRADAIQHAAACEAAAVAMRKACADHIAECLADLGLHFSVQSIRELPTETNALDRMLAEAEARWMERALKAAQKARPAQPSVPPERTRDRYQQHLNGEHMAVDRMEAAIRAMRESRHD